MQCYNIVITLQLTISPCISQTPQQNICCCGLNHAPDGIYFHKIFVSAKEYFFCFGKIAEASREPSDYPLSSRLVMHDHGTHHKIMKDPRKPQPKRRKKKVKNREKSEFMRKEKQK
jgi:hypothetical protein